MEKFFVISPLGCENFIAEEINEVWPTLWTENRQPHGLSVPKFQFFKGGVEFLAPLDLGIQLNFFLKTPGRVLLREREFKVTDFPEMFNKARKVPWGNYLKKGSFEISVSASKSKLGNQKRIEEVFLSAIEDFDKHQTLPESKTEIGTQTVFVRMDNDVCQVSFDTSGENLYKRQYKQWVNEAPLRENLAAMLIRFMCQNISSAEMANISLIDPMAGSGTFLLEAYHLFSPLFLRTYAFENFKITPNWLKSDILNARSQKVSKHYVPTFGRFLAVDQDSKALGILKENFQTLQDKLQILNGNAFEINADKLADKLLDRRFIILNPPYGKRLPLDRPNYHQELFDQLVSLRPEKIGMILPKGKAVKSHWPARKMNFSNGGLHVTFYVFEMHS